MKPSILFSLSVALLWSCCDATPFPFNMSAEGSGEGEPEITDPGSFTTRSPVHVSPTTRITTVTRIKNFILNQVVDFLRENLLLIIVVSSLVIVLIFIVCCASVMSHKRKLNAYYPSSFPAKRYVDHKDKKGGVRTFTEVSGKPPCAQQTPPVSSMRQTQTDTKVVTKNLRTPSKALVGDRESKEAKPNPCEVQHSKEDCSEKKQPVETTQVIKQEEPKLTPGTTQPLVCLCHLKKGNLTNGTQNSPGLEHEAAHQSASPTSAKVQGVVVEII